MKLQVFTVYDKAVQAYLPPFYTRSKGEALRSFSEACNDDKSNFNKHASDYVLMFLGEFDDNAGRFSGSDPVRIISALECVLNEVEKEVGGNPDVKKITPRLPM